METPGERPEGRGVPPGEILVREGWDVYTADREKIGTVDEIHTATADSPGYFVMEKGWIFTEDSYVPQDQIASAEPGKVYLKCARDQCKQMNWAEPPERARGRTEEPSEMRMPVREEELEAQKRMRESGEVRVGKEVTEEERTIRVPVMHEELEVERHKVDRPAEEGVQASGTTRVPLREEEVEVRKEPKVTEEIEVKKRPVVEEKEITEKVRREEPHVEKDVER